MDAQVQEKLLALNRSFYDALADSFTETRATMHPGFSLLLDYLPADLDSLLDVGCGNGRFGHFLAQHRPLRRVTGVDFSVELLQKAADLHPGEYLQRDLSKPGALTDLGQFAAVSMMAALHHIPGRDNRVRLLQDMAACLAPAGKMILSTWNFMDSERQRRKMRDWSEVGLSPADLEPDDYLLTWNRGGFAYRYVCMLDEAAMADLAQAAGLRVTGQFRSDGKEGTLSLYTILDKLQAEE
jgi:SAM-dependent methyltransferase